MCTSGRERRTAARFTGQWAALLGLRLSAKWMAAVDESAAADRVKHETHPPRKEQVIRFFFTFPCILIPLNLLIINFTAIEDSHKA